MEEYLQELTITLDDGDDDGQNNNGEQGENAKTNFAHAALILQNSSNVYSRKVEYLHSLVYKALYEFFKSTNSRETASSRRKSGDSAIEEFYDFDPHNEFLLLDDVVPEDFTSKKINLKEDDDDEASSTSSTAATPNQSMASLNRTRLSLGGLSVSRAERASFGGGSFNPSSSSQQRALMGTLNDGALRLVNGKCDVGADGLLLLPGSSLAAPETMLLDPTEGRRSLFGDETVDPPVAEAHGGEGQAGGQNDFATHQDYDDDDDGPGFEMNDDWGDEPADAPPHQDNQSMVDATVGHQQQEAPRKRVTFQEENTNNKKKSNPWAMMDPHCSEKQIHKPIRRSKTYKLPPGINLPPSECVTGASTRRVAVHRPLSPPSEDDTCLAVETFRAFFKKTGEPPKIPFNGLVFGDEFAYIAKRTAKKKASERRLQRIAQREAQQELMDPTNDAFGDENAYDDDDDYGGGFDFGGNDHDDYDGGDQDNGMGNTGMSSLDEAFQNDNGDETNLGKTFEELCRAHIQAFAKGADDFALNTKLSERVNKWQAKLSPILEEEERRAAFDIHQYSERLLHVAEDGLKEKRRMSDPMEVRFSCSCILIVCICFFFI